MRNAADYFHKATWIHIRSVSRSFFISLRGSASYPGSGAPYPPTTLQGVIGVSEDAIRGDCSTLPGNELELIAQQAKEMNKKVGVVSTARITHATPAGVYARSVDRDFEAEVPEGCTEQVDIAQQVCYLAL